MSRMRAFDSTKLPGTEGGANDEENLSAERPSAEEDPRIPGANEDQQGAPGPEAPACEREEEADGVIHPGRGERLRPADRIRKKAEFDNAYASGERIPSRFFTLIARPTNLEHPRLGLTISRAVGPSVKRNAVRRRLREAFRRNRDVMTQGLDIIIQVKPGAPGATYAELVADLRRAIQRYGERRRRS